MVGCCIEDVRRFSDISAISRQEITISKIVVVRPRIEPRTSCSCSLCCVIWKKMPIWRLKRFLYSFCIYFVAKFYGRLRLISSVLRASKLSVLKIDKDCNFMGLLHRHFSLQLVLVFLGIAWQKFHKILGGLGSLMYEYLIPELRIWSIY